MHINKKSAFVMLERSEASQGGAGLLQHDILILIENIYNVYLPVLGVYPRAKLVARKYNYLDNSNAGLYR